MINIGYLAIIFPFIALMVATMFAGWKCFFFVWGFTFASIASIYYGLTILFEYGVFQ